MSFFLVGKGLLG